MKVFAKIAVWFFLLLTLLGIFLILTSPNHILAPTAKAFFFLGLIIISLFSKRVKNELVDNPQNDIHFFSIQTFELFRQLFFNIFGTFLLCYHLNYFVKSGFENLLEMSPGFFLSIWILYFSYKFQPALLLAKVIQKPEVETYSKANWNFKEQLNFFLLIVIPPIILPMFLSGINQDFDFYPKISHSGKITNKIPSSNPFFPYSLIVKLENPPTEIRIGVLKKDFDGAIISREMEIVERSGFLNKKWFTKKEVAQRDTWFSKLFDIFMTLVLASFLLLPYYFLFYYLKRHFFIIVIFVHFVLSIVSFIFS